MNGQEVTSVISTVTGLVPSNLSVNGLTSLLLQNDNDGFTCEICFKVLSSKNNLKVRNRLNLDLKTILSSLFDDRLLIIDYKL